MAVPRAASGLCVSMGMLGLLLNAPSTLAISVSSSLLLTARLQIDRPAYLFSLAPSRSSSNLPSLKNAKEASVIRLRECSTSGLATRSNVKKPRDWFNLLLRETLGTIFSAGYLSTSESVLSSSGSQVHHSNTNSRGGL